MNSYFKDDSHFRKSLECPPCFNVACVAVAISPKQEVALRNSSDPNKTTLLFTRSEWSVFIKGVKNGEFDLS
ncbi:DUF397 domain-containing protein [Endozoicomonas lisbonensis]|uniref:DUF397 domain-containing protein n=1 Tax=Endozoicomonas lisbonensis TaxID=3120522 RepID=A0ABV2SED9_9GAMM